MAVRAQRISVEEPEKQPAVKRWEGSILDLEPIGHGVSGMVFIIDETRVVKTAVGSPGSKKEVETERAVYRIIRQVKRPSPHILKCFDPDDPRGLVLERCELTVRHRLRSASKDNRHRDLEIRMWATQAAEGLAFIHDHGIIQGDVGCHNMLLDSANVLKICDFAGSSVLGSRAAIVYEVWSRLSHKAEPTRKSDLFALGSAMYEMCTKHPPYHKKRYAEIPKLYQSGRFPSVRRIGSLRNIVKSCWLQKYTNAIEVANAIDPRHNLCCRTNDEKPRVPGAVSRFAASSTTTRVAVLSNTSTVARDRADIANALETTTSTPLSDVTSESSNTPRSSTTSSASLSGITSLRTNSSKSSSTLGQPRVTWFWRRSFIKNKTTDKNIKARSIAHILKIQGLLRGVRTGVAKSR